MEDKKETTLESEVQEQSVSDIDKIISAIDEVTSQFLCGTSSKQQ